VKKLIPYLPTFLLVAFFILVVPRLLFQNEEGLITSHPNVWGDWSTHLAYTSHFSENSPSAWLSQNPLFAGERLRYPFLVNLISALLVRSGCSLPVSLWLVSLACLLGTVALVGWFYRRILGEKIANVGLILFYFGGGLGFLWFALDRFRGLAPPFKDYGQLTEQGIRYGGILTCLLLPQRALQLGICVAVPFLLSLCRETPSSPRKQLAAGCLAGLLPFVHIHTLLCLVVVSFCFVAFHRRQALAYGYLFGAFFLVSTATWIYFQRGAPPASFLSWNPGWIANSPWFWLLNWSLFLPVVVAAFIWVRPLKQVWLITSGILIFILANLVQFQPWDWDNTKLFFWSYALMIPAAAQFLSYLSERRFGKWVAGLLFTSMVATGFIDAGYVITGQRQLTLFSSTELKWARKVRELTPPNAVFLTSSDSHDWVLSLTGRAVAMGYDGWLWSYGINYHPRKADLEKIFSGAPESLLILHHYGITHIAKDSKMKRNFALAPEAFRGFPVLWEEGELTLLAVP